MKDRLWSRKDFLKFMGRGAAAVPAATMLGAFMNRCRPGNAPAGIAPSDRDALLLAHGLNYDILVRHGDIIQNEAGLRFGMNNDYLALLPDRDGRADRLTLWANHETPAGMFYEPTGRFIWRPKNAAEFAAQRTAVGGSCLTIRRDTKRKWHVETADQRNFRIDATTMIPFSVPIDGAEVAEGTFGNCAGGLTPWGTILTCEENHTYYYGDSMWQGGRNVDLFDAIRTGGYAWNRFRPGNRPNHYGWVVEVDPRTGRAQKHVSLGRCFHECATVAQARDYDQSGLVAVYTGDDRYGGCIYKFLSTKAKSVEAGRLFVAVMDESPRAEVAAEGKKIRGRWVELNVRDPRLARFRSQTNVMIHARQAAMAVGGTEQDRPEDIEVDPHSGDVYVTLTYDNKKEIPNLFGSILRIEEDGGDPFAAEFTASVFKSGGTENGFACPDNLVFDPRGNLWMVSDISEKSMNKGEYAPFKNNGLFFIPMRGADAGRVIQVASAPVDAEFTGPCFAPDGRTLFLSVQHPGLRSTTLSDMTSRWPDGDRPKSAVVAIRGELLDRWAAT